MSPSPAHGAPGTGARPPEQTDTPEQELRSAAAILRETANAATPGPWERPLNVRHKHVVTAAKPDDEQGQYLDGRPERVGVVQLNIWSGGAFMRERGGRDLEWIALANPALAEPLAAWLDRAADHECLDTLVACRDATHALEVARTINGAAK